MERADAERSHRQTPNALGVERALEHRRLCAAAEPPREQEPYALRGKPSQRERERAGRRGVEPLEVVDREENRLALGEHLQGAARGDPECARLACTCGRVLEEQRDLERTSLRRREKRQYVGDDVLEQIAQADVREVALGLG